MTALTAVLYDAADCARWERERPACADVFLPLTPAARAALLNAGRTPIAASPSDSPESHRRDAARRADLTDDLERRLERHGGFAAAAGQALIDFAADACGTASRLSTALTVGRRWIVPDGDGWLTTEDRDAAARPLLQRFFAPWNQCDLVLRFGRTPWLLRRRLHRRNLELLTRLSKSRPLAMNAFTRGFARLAEEMHAADPDLYLLSFNPLNAVPASLEYVETLIGYVRSQAPVRPRQVTLTVPPRRLPRTARAARRLLAQVGDPTAQLGIAAYLPTILAQVQWAESVVPIFEQYLRTARARAVLTWDHADRLNAALAEGARRANVASVAACHTSVSPWFDAAAEAAKSRRTRQLVGGALADLTLAQSPAADAAARQASPTVRRLAVQPFVWGSQTVDPQPRDASQPRIILHAGNYFEWGSYLPWAYETSHDFVASLQSLVAATARIPDVRLIVRMKSNFGRKGEFDREALTELISPGPHWEIREGGEFAADLARADLVVSAHSTTIEEALRARKPVLLWGCDQRYRHVAACPRPPDGRSRGAAYFPSSRDDLTSWIERILAAHVDRPLSDAELAEHVWNEHEAWTLPELARRLVDRAAADFTIGSSQRAAA